jgi:hypothetical protein
MVYGLIAWALILRNVESLSRNFRSADMWSAAGRSAATPHQKSKHYPHEHLLDTGPSKGKVQQRLQRATREQLVGMKASKSSAHHQPKQDSHEHPLPTEHRQQVLRHKSTNAQSEHTLPTDHANLGHEPKHEMHVHPLPASASKTALRGDPKQGAHQNLIGAPSVTDKLQKEQAHASYPQGTRTPPSEVLPAPKQDHINKEHPASALPSQSSQESFAPRASHHGSEAAPEAARSVDRSQLLRVVRFLQAGVNQSEKPQHPPTNATRLKSLSGAIGGSHQEAAPAHHLVFDARASSTHRTELSTRLWALGFFIVVVIGLSVAFCYSEDIGSGHAARKAAEGVEPSRTDVERRRMQEAEKRMTANTKAALLEIESAEGMGTWANTYRKADTESKEALELLFRCNIIPEREFAHSFVSQEHIDECVWISSQMLRQKSLEEWVDSWKEARSTFEDSVTACFAARTDVITNLYGDSVPPSPKSPRSDRGLLNCSTHSSPSPPETLRLDSSTANTLKEEQIPTPPEHNRSTFSTWSSLNEDQIPSAGVPPRKGYVRSGAASGSAASKVRPPRQQEYQELLSEEQGRSSVVARCREIMADAQPRSSLRTRHQQSPPSPKPMSTIEESESVPTTAERSDAGDRSFNANTAELLGVEGDAANDTSFADVQVALSKSAPYTGAPSQRPFVASSSADPFQTSPRVEDIPGYVAPVAARKSSPESFGVPVRLAAPQRASPKLPGAKMPVRDLNTSSASGPVDSSEGAGQGSTPSESRSESSDAARGITVNFRPKASQ